MHHHPVASGNHGYSPNALKIDDIIIRDLLNTANHSMQTLTTPFSAPTDDDTPLNISDAIEGGLSIGMYYGFSIWLIKVTS